MRRFFVLLRHEMKLSIRDMNMVIFAVLMPLAILAVLGVALKCFDTVAVLVTLFFPRIAIALRPLLDRKESKRE